MGVSLQPANFTWAFSIEKNIPKCQENMTSFKKKNWHPFLIFLCLVFWCYKSAPPIPGSLDLKAEKQLPSSQKNCWVMANSHFPSPPGNPLKMAHPKKTLTSHDPGRPPFFVCHAERAWLNSAGETVVRYGRCCDGAFPNGKRSGWDHQCGYLHKLHPILFEEHGFNKEIWDTYLYAMILWEKHRNGWGCICIHCSYCRFISGMVWCAFPSTRFVWCGSVHDVNWH